MADTDTKEEESVQATVPPVKETAAPVKEEQAEAKEEEAAPVAKEANASDSKKEEPSPPKKEEAAPAKKPVKMKKKKRRKSSVIGKMSMTPQASAAINMLKDYDNPVNAVWLKADLVGKKGNRSLRLSLGGRCKEGFPELFECLCQNNQQVNFGWLDFIEKDPKIGRHSPKVLFIKQVPMTGIEPKLRNTIGVFLKEIRQILHIHSELETFDEDIRDHLDLEEVGQKLYKAAADPPAYIDFGGGAEYKPPIV